MREIPLIINLNALKRVYQNVVDEDEDGDEVSVYMQATPEFRERLNEQVFEMVASAISTARLNGRNTLWVDDLPSSKNERE